MLKVIDDTWTQSTFLNFRNLGKLTVGAKTDLFEVRNRKTGILLGYVRWWNKWRQYVFVPKEGTVYEKICLTDLSEFLIMVNVKHKEKVDSKRHKPTRIVSIVDHERYQRLKNEEIQGVVSGGGLETTEEDRPSD